MSRESERLLFLGAAVAICSALRGLLQPERSQSPAAARCPLPSVLLPPAASTGPGALCHTVPPQTPPAAGMDLPCWGKDGNPQLEEPQG